MLKHSCVEMWICLYGNYRKSGERCCWQPDVALCCVLHHNSVNKVVATSAAVRISNVKSFSSVKLNIVHFREVKS